MTSPAWAPRSIPSRSDAQPAIPFRRHFLGRLDRASAFRGGLATAALGPLLHFVIAYSATAVYYLMSRAFAFLNRHFAICGLLYGLGVYLFMNLVVLPLTFPNRHPLAGIALVNGVLAVMLCIGLTVSIVVARYSR